MNRIVVSVLVCITTTVNGWAQSDGEVAGQMEEQRIEDAVERSDDDLGFSESLERLEELRKNPINLNTASREELEQLRLLTDFQIFSLLDYRKTYGTLASINELQYIQGFTEEQIAQLVKFAEVKPPPQELPSFLEAMKGGNSQYYLRFQRPVQLAAGYSDSTGYPGEPIKIFTKYAFSFQNLIRAGFTAEKDAGESFPSGKGIRIMDFQSAYFQLRNLNNLKVLTLGDFNLRFGQGLVLWSGFSSGKGIDVVGIRRRADGISPFTSAEENRFFRGAASTIRFSNIELSLFFSMKKLDANISRYDSLHKRLVSFSSFRTDGLHLSNQDVREKDAVGEMIAGGNLNYGRNRFRIGTSWVHTRFDALLLPYRQGYSLYNPLGNNFTAGSVDYQYRIRSFLFFGEMAGSSTGGLAALQGMVVKADPSFTFSLLARNFTVDYCSFYAKPFSESGKCANEQGVFTGFQLILPFHLCLNGYYDVFRFPWLRYEVDAPSSGQEGMLQISWDPSDKLKIIARYRSEQKEANADPEGPGLHSLQRISRQSFRYSSLIRLSETLNMQSRIDLSMLTKESNGRESGILMSQDISWKPIRGWFSLALRYSLFDISSYENRIYTYEKDILYAFSVPSYYGKGSRVYVLFSIELWNRIDLWLKISRTNYDDRFAIGTGDAEIKGNKRTDCGLQLRVRF